MGSGASQEDERHLLDEDYAKAEIPPIFQELKLVVVGHQGAGKNTIGNAIFRKRIFTFWTALTSSHINKIRTVSGRQVHLVRTPGWRGELSKSTYTKQSIVHCVQSFYDTGPNAVLLALKVNSRLTETTIKTLEDLFSVQLWNHTIVLFTNGEALGHFTIEDYIRSEQLQPLIEKCGQRYCVIQKNDCDDFIETIEELISMKKSTRYFKVSAPDEPEVNKLVSEWQILVKKIRSKIAGIVSYENQRQNNNLHARLKSKNAEIERLKKIVQEKEREIERLKSTLNATNLGAGSAEMGNQHCAMCRGELEKKNAEINQLREENQTLQEKLKMYQKAEERNTYRDLCAIQHADIPHCLSLNFRPQVATNASNEIPLQDLSAKWPHNWFESLLNILEELTAAELKKMKDLMNSREEWRIPRGLMESTDRGGLADLMIKKWGERECVLKTRDIMKKIPRKDSAIRDLLEPFLLEIGEQW